jgi:heme/copper-type cytochrome/quinol oxidase subunit 2
MNRKIIVLGLTICVIGILLYNAYETITIRRRGGNNPDGTTYHYSTYETVYPYRYNSLIVVLLGIVTFLIGLAIPKRRD